MAMANSHRPVARTEDDELPGLLARIVARDVTAFVDLWTALSPEITTFLGTVLLDPADVRTVTAATFAEVWWMAPAHGSAQNAVREWVMSIARHRARERERDRTTAASSIGPLGAARLWTTAVNDECLEMIVGSLIVRGMTGHQAIDAPIDELGRGSRIADRWPGRVCSRLEPRHNGGQGSWSPRPSVSMRSLRT
jgi:hypothetical protein